MRRPWDGVDFVLVCLGLLALYNICTILAGWIS